MKKRQTDSLSFLLSKNLAYVEQNNSMLWTKDRTLFGSYFTELLNTVLKYSSCIIGLAVCSRWQG